MASDTATPNQKEIFTERAQLVRIHEANCQLEHPTDEELRFRRATMLRIAETYDYKRVKGVELIVPTQPGKK